MISILNALIVNEGRVIKGNLKIADTLLTEVKPVGEPFVAEGEVIDAEGYYVMPGVIDEHVHFREPGLTQKADIQSETKAAAAGGVTTFFDMPNTKPQTTNVASLDEKIGLGAEKSLINYAFYLGATNDNIEELRAVDTTKIPAVKLFMGASTGNMLVENQESLKDVFDVAKAKGLPVVTHCEDSEMIAANEARIRSAVGDDAGVEYHPVIRDEAVCLSSTRKALSLAQESGVRLLVAHVSTAAEVEEITKCAADVKAEVCVSYLYLNSNDYATLGGRMKCNPAIKTPEDQQHLLRSLTDGKIYTIATDHAPHLLADKQGGVFKATSGMPSLQFSLPLMLQLTDRGVLDVETVARLMSHNPAHYFGVQRRGFIREGYKADLVLLKHLDQPHTITDADVESKCAWTPFAGQQTNWQVEATFCNGTRVYQHGQGFVASEYRGEAVEFDHGHNA